MSAILKGGEIFKGADALAVVRELIKSAEEYSRVRQQEISKRQAIQAAKEERLAEIELKRTVFLNYLQMAHDERASNFDRLFGQLDYALREELHAVGPLLGAITTLAMKSPFADLHDPIKVREMLDDPNKEWEV